jgi:hypothetical protein
MTALLVGWGSSSMAGIGPALEVALHGAGALFLNEGAGGETSHHTAARIGSLPLPVRTADGHLPAAGSVRLEPTELDLASEHLKPFAGRVAGIEAVVHGTAEGVFLTRSAPGAPVAVDGDPFLPSRGEDLQGRDTLLWMGKNDVNRGQSAAGVVERIVATAEHLSRAGARVVIVGQFTNNGADPQQRAEVLAVNTACEEHFGPAHLGIQDLLTSPAVEAGTGLVMSAEDLAEREAGAKPHALSTDPGHFNQIGNHLVAARIVQGLRELGLLPDSPTPRSAP